MSKYVQLYSVEIHMANERVQCYNGNTLIKADGVEVEYTREQLEEYVKCATDIVYFVENYCMVMTLDHGFTHIVLRDYQKRFFRFLEDNRFVVGKWSRQSSKTSSSVLYILWKVLFHKDQTWFLLANKLDTAREAFSRLKDTYESLPFWLQIGVKKLNESTIELSNGSSVVAAASSKSAIRGRTANGILWDEAAFVDNDDEFYTSVFPVISSGQSSQFIMVSTPNGMNNVFYRTYKDCKDGRGEFRLTEIEWNEIPGRNDAWREKMIGTIGERRFSQEFCCSFLGAEGSLIPLDILERISIKSPIHEHNNMSVYEDPQPNHQYVIICDVARGVGIDSSVFSVMDCTTLPYKQVAVYRNNDISTMLYPHVIYAASRRYNDAYILVEINDAGGQVADILHYDLECETVLWVGSKGRGGQTVGSSVNSKPGVRTTTSVKAMGCGNLRTMFDAHKIEICDKDTFTELTSFVAKGNSYEADRGSHDDCVMTLVLFAWLADQPYFNDMFNKDTRRDMIEQKLKQLEEDLVPIGFFTSGRENSLSSPTVVDYSQQPQYRDELTDWFLS